MNAARDDGSRPELRIVRRFDAPPTRVYRMWIDPDEIGYWFAPDGYACTRCELDARVGGRWLVEYRSTAGDAHTESGEFRELDEPTRLVLTLTQRDTHGHVGPETTVTVTFVAVGEQTEMTFLQTGFERAAYRDANAAGWQECFGKLAARLAGPESDAAAEREVRELFSAWWRDCAAKDIDRAMQPIAPDAISYEHEAPLQHRGIAAIRAVCQRGFDAAEGDFRWDMPDLQVIVRGDLAVTWGLNRMRTRRPDGAQVEVWSRGTRIFQKTDGQWKMIHQHVSFPFDPQTGKVETDLRP